MADSTTVTRLLQAWREGDVPSRDQLVAHVYHELHQIAAHHLRAEQAGHTLQATALIHEAFIRLVDIDVQWTGRTHFFAVAARVMRQILVDHARARGRLKRGGGQMAVTLDEALVVSAEPDPQILELDDALRRLETLDPRKARAVELHYFGGLTYEELAELLDVSVSTVHRELRMAKAWLYHELQSNSPSTQ
ncbi:MAG: sigma-70 family RNA polymerase sigma factor [Longimicrobiales bacterium]